MSATGRGTPRSKSDFYETPALLAYAAIEYIRTRLSILRSPKLILDPGAGRGAWGIPARAAWPESRIVGIDRYRLASPAARPAYDDWSRTAYATFARRYSIDDRPNLIIGNPPFRLAQSFVEISRGLIHPLGLIIFLLRINFLAGECRKGFWQEYPLSRLVTCIERPSFRGNGTDATEYALFVWTGDKFFTLEGPAFDWISWRQAAGAKTTSNAQEK